MALHYSIRPIGYKNVKLNYRTTSVTEGVYDVALLLFDVAMTPRMLSNRDWLLGVFLHVCLQCYRRFFPFMSRPTNYLLNGSAVIFLDYLLNPKS